ncbi:MAG: hypothetical protein JO254_12435 [Pseudolabrys sp.]|nr:hypothetical protein [Pseudolabrys sp.]
MIPSPRRVLESWAALVGIWGASYVTTLKEMTPELAEYAEGLQWPLVLVGAMGTGSALWSSWKIARHSGRRRS